MMKGAKSPDRVGTEILLANWGKSQLDSNLSLRFSHHATSLLNTEPET